MGAFEGVKLAWEEGVKKFILEMDYIEAIDLLSGQIQDQNILEGRVKDLLERRSALHVSR